MTYYLYMKGVGEGCDYTIGCNQDIKSLSADNMEEALAEAREVLDERGAFSNSTDCVPKSAFICKHIANIDIRAERLNRRAKAHEAERLAAESAERSEYERLKAKFEGGGHEGQTFAPGS